MPSGEEEKDRVRAELEELLSKVMTLKEAQSWLEAHKAEFGVSKTPNYDTLRKAHQRDELVAVYKGDVTVTTEKCLRLYMQTYSEFGGRHAAALKKSKNS